MRDVVREAALGRRAVAEEPQAALALELGDEPLFAIVDPRRLADAFLALLDNAIRFTADGGAVRVTTRQ